MFYTREKSHWHSVALQDIYAKTEKYRELKAGKRPHLNTTLVALNGCQEHFTVILDNGKLLFKANDMPLRFNIQIMSDTAIACNLALMW